MVYVQRSCSTSHKSHRKNCKILVLTQSHVS